MAANNNNNNNNVNRLKIFEKDIPNFSSSFIPGQGSTIRVPKPPTSQTAREISEALESGTIDTSNVTSRRVHRELLRQVLDHKFRAAAPRNGQRPESLQIDMTDSVVAMAENVDSIKRSSLTYWSMGAVEERAVYDAGTNQLRNTMGATPYGQFKDVISSTHAYAINHTNAVAAQGAAQRLTDHVHNLRDGLCLQLGNPQSVQDQIVALHNQIHQKNADITQKEDMIRQQNDTIKAAEHHRLVIVSAKNETIRSIENKHNSIVAALQRTIKLLEDQIERLEGEETQDSSKKRKAKSTAQVSPPKAGKHAGHEESQT